MFGADNLSLTCTYTPHALSALSYIAGTHQAVLIPCHGHSNRQYHPFNSTGWYPEKAHQKVNKMLPKAKESCVPSLTSGNGYTAWLSVGGRMWHNLINWGVWLNCINVRTSFQVPAIRPWCVWCTRHEVQGMLPNKSFLESNVEKLHF